MTKPHLKKLAALFSGLLLSGFLGCAHLFAQETTMLQDLSDFKPNKGTWHQAGQVTVEMDQPNSLKFEKGEGILVNSPTKKNHGIDLVSNAEFGDIDLELEFMVANQSNSGVYLMGQYEIQIMDSWTNTNPRAGDMGGIYERWDDSKPEGQKGYEGYPPRQNVSGAPGVWQQLHVSFQAPRFDQQGQKIQNAKFISVTLNGVIIHENLEVSGPTRGALQSDDVAVGPIRIQGDHGAVAFRNIKVTKFDTEAPKISELNYEIYKGGFDESPDFSSLTPDEKGTLPDFQEKTTSPTGQNLIRYRGQLSVPESGEYLMRFGVPSGWGSLIIDGQKKIDMGEGMAGVKTELEKGSVTFEILASKTRDWTETGLDWEISGPGLRYVSLSESSTGQRNATDPILVNERETPQLRSFIDLPNGQRITHALSVSSPQKIHYSYDLGTGNLVQVWRGDFLDATPMWNSRGNGVSIPLGSVVFLGNPESSLLDSQNQHLTADYKSKGYKLNDSGIEFTYGIQNIQVKDVIAARADGKGLERTITAENPANNVDFSLATGEEIRMISDGLYLVSDKGYYIELDPKTPKPRITSSPEGQQLLVSLDSPIHFSLLF